MNDTGQQTRPRSPREIMILRLDAQNTRLEAAKRQPPSKGRNRAIQAAAASKQAILQSINQQADQDYLDRRLTEIETLEALRGGGLQIEERLVEVPVLHDGIPQHRRGRAITTTELVTTHRISARDGLQCLATAHIKADGSPIMHEGKPCRPALMPDQLSALLRYRQDYEAFRSSPLGAVDPSDREGGAMPYDPARSNKLPALMEKAISAMDQRKHGMDIESIEAHVTRWAGPDALRALRDVAGEGHTIRSIAPGRRRAVRLTKALIAAADLLAERYRLSRAA